MTQSLLGPLQAIQKHSRTCTAKLIGMIAAAPLGRGGVAGIITEKMRRAAQSSRPERGPWIDYALFFSLGFSSVILNGSTSTFGTLLAPATNSF